MSVQKHTARFWLVALFTVAALVSHVCSVSERESSQPAERASSNEIINDAVKIGNGENEEDGDQGNNNDGRESSREINIGLVTSDEFSCEGRPIGKQISPNQPDCMHFFSCDADGTAFRVECPRTPGQKQTYYNPIKKECDNSSPTFCKESGPAAAGIKSQQQTQSEETDGPNSEDSVAAEDGAVEQEEIQDDADKQQQNQREESEDASQDKEQNAENSEEEAIEEIEIMAESEEEVNDNRNENTPTKSGKNKKEKKSLKEERKSGESKGTKKKYEAGKQVVKDQKRQNKRDKRQAKDDASSITQDDTEAQQTSEESSNTNADKVHGGKKGKFDKSGKGNQKDSRKQVEREKVKNSEKDIKRKETREKVERKDKSKNSGKSTDYKKQKGGKQSGKSEKRQSKHKGNSNKAKRDGNEL
ncbi:hypothetical protein Ocin01_10212 [Orchesella cincta]|uniref:Chitin-binding type-2 domain-containing protein n=1 Tax=Orchesella cincta TaxID=48709 RepID=A0A1D2MTN9_ORCCI|nr:hypothetical protein Ocin01_10212 [Orchesella cincta]